MPLDDVKPFTEIVDRSISPKRLLTILLAAFSILALLLASVGIYGVVAYSVNQRTQEIGIRLALGSPRHRILQHVLSEGIKVTLLGCTIGIAAALGFTRVLQSQLFGVTPSDPLTYLVTSLVLLTVALLACWVPAHRATQIDPMVALKHE
jgi:ABC-type antimicrobial peptide transport system permease subunit